MVRPVGEVVSLNWVCSVMAAAFLRLIFSRRRPTAHRRHAGAVGVRNPCVAGVGDDPAVLGRCGRILPVICVFEGESCSVGLC
jgi:hypothetical protein